MAKRVKFQTPTGMHDILSEEEKYFERIYNVIKSVVDFYGFKKIETPILEERELFSKGVGLTTDIVEKQMFTLRTKGRDYLALRPEGTASIVRAYIENGMYSLPKPVKLWYFGPYFRYERPQAGRYRQFWQFGLEILGEESSAMDAQVIQLFYSILKDLRLKNLIIEVNSIGSSCCRPYYKKILTNYFKSRSGSLCINCKKRLRENPLRILDCKEEKCQRIIFQGPQTIEHLCKHCRRHFKEVLEFLDELELPYHLNPYLVRGLDYYTRTVFEIFAVEKSKEPSEIPPVKNALAGGGRYDLLVRALGGKETPAVGGAAGIERLIELMKKGMVRFQRERMPQIFLAQLGISAKRRSLRLMEEFRKAKIPVAESLGRDSLRTQLKMADKIGVKYTLILGQKEVLKGEIIVRYMESGKQKTVKLEKMVKEMKKLLKK